MPHRAHGLLAAAVLAATAPSALAASQDGTVEWDGLSHVGWQDRRPLVPLRSEAFAVRFQAFRGDLTSARVLQTVAGTTTAHDASVVATDGPYDVWQATLPGAGDDTLGYVIELTDGADTDYLSPAGVTDAAPAPASGWALDFVTLDHAPIGATPIASGTVFKVWAPTRASCHVRGQFNNWTVANPMTKVGEHFVALVPGATAGQMYKYFFNNTHWNTDPRGRQLNQADNTNAVIIDPLAYDWQVEDFTAPPLDQMVIYQLHVGSFAGRNDPFGAAPTPSGYRHVGDRADHLAELGVNAVMLNPVHEFPGNNSGGYNPITAWGVERALGSPDDLKYMVDELHERGIAVILDIVWNHMSATDNFLYNYDGSQTYFDTPHIDTPWGAQPDYDNPNVRAYFTDAVDLLLGEYRMDGFRMDAVMAMTDSGWTSQWPSGQQTVREINAKIDRRYADAVNIAELYIDSAWATNPPPAGIGFDSQYYNNFKNSLRGAVFAAAGGNPNMAALAGAIDGNGPGASGRHVMTYFELHDDAWPLNGHERAVKQIDPTFPHDDDFARGRTTLANALTILAPGVPAILQGTEWLEDQGWADNKIDWSHKTTYAPIFDFYSDAIALRTTEPALFADAPVWVYHVNDSANILAFERSQPGGESFVVIANLSNSDWPTYRLGLPRAGTWEVLLSNQWAQYGGPGAGASGVLATEPIAHGPNPQSALISIPARGLLLLRHAPACNPADCDANALINVDDVECFAAAFLADAPAADCNASGVINVDDVECFVSAFLAGCP